MALLLVVDDEPLFRQAIRRTLEQAGHDVVEASSVQEAREALSAHAIELVLCDINMPSGSGLELVRSISSGLPQTAVIMLTGIDDPAVAEQALDLGAYGYLVKPVERNEVLINVSSGLRRRELELAQRGHVHELESKILDRSTALRQVLRRLEETQTQAREAEREIVERLVTALTLRSEETGSHIQRVGEYSALLAHASVTDGSGNGELRLAAMLHDVGKIGIPDAILLKPGRLTHREFDVIKRHPSLGSAMLEDGRSPVLKLGAQIALSHHEWWDGSGYPRGLAGNEIPFAGRIVAIADVFDALTSHRVYRRAMPLDAAVHEMQQARGRQFDPDLLDLFTGSLDQVESIRSAHPDPVGVAEHG